MVKLRHLRYFIGIVDEGSVSRAAKAMFVSQPTLSQQLSELEAELGVQLLVRSVRGVRPTPAGKTLYLEAAQILRSVERLPGIVRSAGCEAVGTVSLGVTSSLAPVLAGALMATCNASLPAVTLRFVTDDSPSLHANVVQGELDLAIVLDESPRNDVHSEPLFLQRLFLVDRKRPGRAARAIKIERIAGMPLVLPPPRNGTRVVIDRALSEAGLTPRVAAEANILWALLAAVASGIGAAVLPFGDLSISHGYENFVSTPIEPSLFQTAQLIAPVAPPGGAVAAVRALVRSSIAEMVSRRQVRGMESLAG